jgi:hypothetical protein
MALDIFSTHTMLMAVEQINPLHTFLRDRYFPTNPATDIFTTEDVLVEFKDGSKKLAPFVAPRKGGVTVLRQGYTLQRYTPPFIAPKRTMTADDLKKKGFGEALFSNLTPAQRQGALMMKDFEELDAMIARREEAMAAETMLTNGCIMKHICDDADEYEEKSIQFYTGDENPAQYTPDTDWDETGARIIDDIAAVAEIMASKGLAHTDLIVAPDVGSAILADSTIKELLDIKNLQIGGIDPATLPEGCVKLGRLNCKGHIVDILQYSDTYTNDAGEDVPYITPGKAILTAPGCGRTLYGAVTQVEQSDGLFHTYGNKRVPKYFSDSKGNTRELYLTSCPLCIPNNKNAFYVINAINESTDTEVGDEA